MSQTGVRFSAILNVRNARAALDFYQRAFGATILWTTPGGNIVANLSIEGAEFWIAEEFVEYSNPGPELLGGTTVRLMIITPNPDAMFDRATKAGAKVVSPLADRSYGWRDGRVQDPFGHHWEIGCPLDKKHP